MTQDLLDDFIGIRKAIFLVNLIAIMVVSVVVFTLLTELHGFPNLARGPLYILENQSLLLTLAGTGALIWVVSSLFFTHRHRF